MSRYTKAEQEDAIKRLREFLPEGSTVHLSLSKVSRSGMSRVIRCLIIDGDDTRDISWLVAIVLGMTHVGGMMGGVRIGGCGMDMGLALVDSLSYKLYDVTLDQTPEHQPATGKGIRYNWM